MSDLVLGIQHIGIPTLSMEKTEEFYKKLGFEIAFQAVNDGAKVVFLKNKDLVVEAYESKDASMRDGAIDHVALTVSDIEAAYEWIGSLGFNTLKDEIHYLPFWDNGVKFFTIEGPNHERVEFSQFL